MRVRRRRREHPGSRGRRAAPTRPVAGLPRPMADARPRALGGYLHVIDDVLDGLLGFLDGF